MTNINIQILLYILGKNKVNSAMWVIYILLCNNNTLYTGITNNLEKRLEAHKKGVGSKYVRSHLPFKLIYTEKAKDKISAAKREFEIKSWSRKEKIENLKLSI